VSNRKAATTAGPSALASLPVPSRLISEIGHAAATRGASLDDPASPSTGICNRNDELLWGRRVQPKSSPLVYPFSPRPETGQ
jgi:hypothetical protein